MQSKPSEPPEPDSDVEESTIFWLRMAMLLSLLIPWAVFAAVALYAHDTSLYEAQRRMERIASIAHEQALRAYETQKQPAPETFTAFYRELANSEEGTMLSIVGQDGRVIARWPLMREGELRASPGGPLMTAIARGENRGLLRGVSRLDGVKRIGAFRQVGRYPVYVVAGSDEETALGSWRRQLYALAAFILPLSLCLAFISWQALRRTQRHIEASRALHREAHERQKVEAALRQSQKLEAMGHLTGGVAHDFNNLLMVVNLNATLLKQKVGEAQQRQIEAIERAVAAGKKLTRQLLAFSRRQPLVPRVVDLTELMPALEDLIRPALGSSIGLEMNVAAGTRPVKIDTGEFELALINLAINARDAMPDGGMLNITAGNEGESVEIAVRDTGTGIAPENMERVFEPFFTTKPVGSGTGLGLSQVYGLCARAGGSARIESQVGKGTTVFLRFPAAIAETAEPGAANDGVGQPLEKLSLRVLMVEDNRDVAMATRELLEGAGCRVVHAVQPDEALEVLGRDQRFDLVLTDIVMPGGMDGLQFQAELRRLYPKLPVVLMTGYAEKLGEAEAKNLVVLPKPFDAGLLVRTLREQQARAAETA
ncbi:ATP-binding protein [Ramlibacter albus]|uniref:histidine kinase n=1 Tax=Ramlibacter albus TaxID=2079448 RepID=A0A923M6W7_9BURK|nr:ATP-binding protein [Ramlibacter albus]MBC5763914.1 response regulator [Ramlibacter albus]